MRPAAATTAAGSNPHRGMELSRSGWLEKYSVGRGIIPVRNWQRRYFTVTHSGLNYSKGPDLRGDSRTYIPFVASEGMHEVRLHPVFLFPHITESVHPAANDPNYQYFGIRFEEKGKPHVLLLRCASEQERDQWVRFISQYVHAGTVRGVPTLHPLDSGSPRVFDPEELDPNEKRALRRAVVDWDEGQDLRALYGPSNVELDDAVDDDDLSGGGGGPQALTPPKGVTPSASAVQTPRGGYNVLNAATDALELAEREDEDGMVDQGRSGVQPSVRSYARQASVAARSHGHGGVPLAELPSASAEYDVL